MKTVHMATNSLSSAALNWLSAQILNINVSEPHVKTDLLIHDVGPGSARPGVPEYGVCIWDPMTVMSQLCGLQDEFFIDVNHCRGRSSYVAWQALTDSRLPGDPALTSRSIQHGVDRPTAILRVLVQAHYGDTVELPVELLPATQAVS